MNYVHLSSRPYLYTIVHLFFGVAYALRHSENVKVLTFIDAGAFKLSNPNRNEAITRKERIDPALKKVGWDINNSEQVRTEIPVDGFDPKAWESVKRILEAFMRATYQRE